MAEIDPIKELKAIEIEEKEDIAVSRNVYKALLILAGIALFGLIVIMAI